MHPIEIEDILKTFSIVADTREQSTSKAKKRFEAFGVPVSRATLNYGDYCANVVIDDKPLHDINGRISAPCCIERKMSLDELAGNFGRGRKRFEREFERARDNGCRIYLLVEDATWEKILGHHYRSKFTPAALTASILAWMARYDLKLIFCSQLSTGLMIRNILYRELKERLSDE